MSIAGRATAAGTRAYAARFAGRLAAEHFRSLGDLTVSSLGIGTYLGEHDDATDALYADAVQCAVERGCNVIDTAINYRFQRSERAVGAALRALLGTGFRREELVVATKGGFLPFDGAPPADAAAWFQETFVAPGVARFEDIVAGCHVMTPGYIQHQLDASRRNLGLDCLDIYYLHNPETQLQEVSKEEFFRRLQRAFETLEANVAAGKLARYGTATWNAYRMKPNALDYVALEEVAAAARQVAGEGRHFKVLQLPLNLGMPQALGERTQPVSGRMLSALEAARELGLAVVASASIHQGQMARGLPPLVAETFPGLETDAQRALQFTRSAPGVRVALVGMRQRAHVEENLAVATLPPAPEAQFRKLFR